MVTCCAVDPQGKWVVSGADDGTVRLWDVAAGNGLIVLRIDDSLSGCAWFPDGQRIVASARIPQLKRRQGEEPVA